MDGNGRWAKARHLPRVVGHQRGVEAVRKLVRSLKDTPIECLTLYAFSSENWKRPEDEVDDLMNMMRKFIKSDLPEFIAVDLSKLEKGASLHLKDIKLPKGVVAKVRGGQNNNPVLVSVVPPVVVVETPADAAPAADAKGKGKGKK